MKVSGGERGAKRKMKEEEGEEEEEVEMEDGEENTPEEEQKSKKIPPRKRQLEHKNRFISELQEELQAKDSVIESLKGQLKELQSNVVAEQACLKNLLGQEKQKSAELAQQLAGKDADLATDIAAVKAREGAVSKAELAFLKWKLEQEIEEAGRLEAADRTEAALDSRKSDLDAREAKLKKLEKLAGLSH